MSGMYKRVYEYYRIKVTTDEDVKYIFKEGIDKTSYKDIIRLYRETKNKETSRGAECKVELVGITQEGIEVSIFAKNISYESREEKELLTRTVDIVNDIKYNLNLLERKREYHRNMMSCYDRKQETLLHKVETVKKLKGTKRDIQLEKLKLFDRIEQVRNERRFCKMEDKNIKSLFSKVNIEDLSNQLVQFEFSSDNSYEYIDDRIEENIIKEVPYMNDKDRVKKLKSLTKKYKKIVNDSVNKKLICSNSGYHSNK